MARKRSEHYVNNKEFLAAIVEYKEKVALAAERGEAKPRITNYLGECFLKIATHLSFKPNFVIISPIFSGPKSVPNTWLARDTRKGILVFSLGFG